MPSKTNEEYNALAEMLADAMMDKINEQGIIGDVIQQYQIDELCDRALRKFSVKLITQGRIYIHNCGKYNEEQIAFIDLLTDTMQAMGDIVDELEEQEDLNKQGELDETRD